MFFCLAILYLSEPPQVKKLLNFFLGKDKQNAMCTWEQKEITLFVNTKLFAK